MIKVRDGYGKLIGSDYNGNIAHVLLSNGGNLQYAVGSTASTLVLRNASGQIESSVASTVAPFVISSTKVNANLNADLLDGFLATGLFQSLTSAADKNLYIKIGNTEKEVPLLYASYLGGVTKEGLFTELTNVNDSTNPNSIKVTIGDTTKYLKVAYSDLASKVVCTASKNNTDEPIVVTDKSSRVYYSPKVTLNYNTGNVTAPTFTGTLIGNADTATTASKLSTVSKTAWGLTYWTSGGVPTSISGDMTGVGNITIASGGNVDRFITFDTASTRSWRIGYLGSGSSDANYLAFQSTKTLTAADGWHDMLKIGCETGNATFTGQLTAAKFIGPLNNTLTFSAGTFSAKTYNNSETVTVNIPTHTSHLTNNSGFLTLHQSLANYVTLNTNLTITGLKTFQSSSDTTGVSLILKNKNWYSNMATAMDFYNGSSYTVPNARIETKMVGNGNAGGTLIFYTLTKHASTNPNPNGLTERLRINDNGLITITGNLTVTGTSDFSAGTVKLDVLNIPTSSGGTTFGPGSNGQVLKSNGTTVYWASDSNSNTWRAIQVNGTQIAGTGTSTYALNFISGTGITVAGTSGSSSAANSITITNAGVRSTTINGNYLRVNTNGTNANLTIPYATTASLLSNTSVSDPSKAASGLYLKWYSLVSQASGYAGTNYGFPVSNNANGILWLGTHSGPYGWQMGFSSNGRIYARYISNNSFSTTANGGSWNRIAWTSDIPAVTNYYWANVKVSATSSTTTTPTFANTVINGTLTMGGTIIAKSGSSTQGIKFENSYLNSISSLLLWQSSEAIRFGSTNWDWNAWAGLKYNHSSKIIYLGLADGTIFNANSGLSGGKLYLPGISDAYVGNGTYKILHLGNSSVSGGGSAGGSSITVNIGNNSKTLTIPTRLPANGGTSSYTNYLKIHDVRGTNHLPNSSTYPEKNITAWFNNTGTPDGSWWSGITVKGWTSDYSAWLLCSYSSTGTANNYGLYVRNGVSSGWGSWRVLLDSGNSSIGDYNVKINGTTKQFVRDWGHGAANMNAVARRGRSSMGMADLSTPSGGTATAVNPNGGTSWHHFINIAYTDGGAGSNSWITQIANKAGTTDLWVRSRSGGTISDTANWAAGWTRILTGTNYTHVLDSRYVNTAGDTMTGPLTFANGTWNVVGDDAAIGDYNAAGMLGLKSINNNIPGIGFHNKSNTLLGRLQANGSNLLWNDNKIWHAGNDGSGSGLDADTLDGYHRSNLFTSYVTWMEVSGLNKSITVGGNADTYYPVVISVSSSKLDSTRISVWKDLGSTTPSYSGNHSNGTSSLWLIYEGRNWMWDGNGGFLKTWYKYQGYATLVAHAELAGSGVGNLVLYLRGGGCLYNIACSHSFTATVYTASTNIGSSSYPVNVAPRTTIGNGGILLSRLGYGYVDSASTATLASTVTVNNSDANSTYRMVWHSGNTLYSTAGIYCNPSTDCLYASHYYETSDIAFKTNIKPILNSDNIPVLKSFDWKSDGSHSYGLIALELEAMGYPELVSEGDGYKTVNYSAALSLIVGKLQVKIKELEKEIEILKNKN